MRTISKILFLILFISFINTAYSQSSYFPLSIGNKWTFTFQNSLHTEEIVDTMRVNGNLYYGLAIWTSNPQYWFRESNDSVYILDTLTNSEILLYNFNADIGESWELISDFNCWLGNEITLVSKSDTIVTPSGKFVNCYHFTHEQNCADAGVYNSWFAEGIGRVRYFEDNIAGMRDYKLSDYIISSPVKVDEELQKVSYSLSQNYPNPFNPSTKIKYSIPRTVSPLPGGARGGLVTLKVYDVLGREIATLVNEEKPAGIYELQFTNYDLASGVYYYQLKAGNFVETKKMILLK